MPPHASVLSGPPRAKPGDLERDVFALVEAIPKVLHDLRRLPQEINEQISPLPTARVLGKLPDGRDERGRNSGWRVETSRHQHGGDRASSNCGRRAPNLPCSLASAEIGFDGLLVEDVNACSAEGPKLEAQTPPPEVITDVRR